MQLPVIPFVDLGPFGLDGLLPAHAQRYERLRAEACRDLTPAVVAFGDRVARLWAAGRDLPYRDEITAVARGAGRPGAWLMNLNYEFGCTCGIATAPDGAPVLLRALDWGRRGVGATIVAARREGRAGPWTALTWPGFVGIVQGLAPGRFAAAINQAPRGSGPGAAGAWAGAQWRLWRARGLPPALLLRRVFDLCPDFTAARRMLAETPLAAPAIFTLVGTRPGETAVVERTERRAVVQEDAVAVSNHWLTAGFPGAPRAAARRREPGAAGRDAGQARRRHQRLRLARPADPQRDDAPVGPAGAGDRAPLGARLGRGRPRDRPARPDRDLKTIRRETR
ncbi:hypothetical protein [Arenibaculum sp.]|jgi:hypothetical protein|uniref:hypothetical protein n=1 Tax=Arenibaculum sp. TaxID=2865862 RepID=UPI002E13E9A6|nr:hypothetical protein [Arenibaculum sp.]